MAHPLSGAAPVVCFAEALVDLVCERPVASLGDAPGFVPRVGGSLVNIAVAAARFGAPAQIVGGAGDDEWGRWLRERIGDEGVDVSCFALAPGAQTALAFVAVSESGEPGFAFHGGAERAAAHAGADLEAALEGEPGVLALGSDTLLAPAERELTARAATLGRERGWTVLFDPNLRPQRWLAADEMLASVRTLLERANVVKCNGAEARALTGAASDEAAAAALLGAGPELAIVTRGRHGALVASGSELAEVAAPPATEVVDATGAGDCVAGVLAAGLAAGASGQALGRVVALAVAAAAGVVGSWGAGTGLPPAAAARAALAEALGGQRR